MRKIFCVFGIVLLLSGCATAVMEINEKYLRKTEYEEDTLLGAKEKIKRDYLKGDEYSSQKVKDSMKSIKYDYLKAKKPVLDKKRLAAMIFKAKKVFFATEYKDDYFLDSVWIDEAYGMPEAAEYIFMHFDCKINEPELAGTTYLVVINRIYDTVVFSGVFTPEKGDSFYRYREVIGNRSHKP